MPDLATIIAAYEQRQAVQPVVALTPLGAATLTAERLVRQLADLDHTDQLRILLDVVEAVPGFGLSTVHAPVLDPSA